MDLHFYTPQEIVDLLGVRLKQARLLQEWTQAELAQRAGITKSTLSNLESGKNTSLETLVTVAMVLGRSEELTELFQPRVSSIEDIKRLEKAQCRQRIRGKKRD